MTVRLFLVRHAEAAPSSGDDGARRLTASGRTRFAAQLAALGERLRPSRILSSPLVRARETAALLAEATGAPVEEEPALAPGASSAAELLALGRARGPGVALVGHNPEIAEAVAAAAARGLGVPPGAIAALEVDATTRPRLLWLDLPADPG